MDKSPDSQQDLDELKYKNNSSIKKILSGTGKEVKFESEGLETSLCL